MSPPQPIVLASTSAIRATLLRNAGLSFRIVRPGVDEAALKLRMAGADIPAIAQALADAKALAVAAPGAFVIGADQILEFRGEAYDKPGSRAEARKRLLALQGAPHTLVNALAIARDGAVVFRHLERPRLFMRALSSAEVDRYLDAAGDEVLASVGAYQVEGLGAQLFERIDGDYFAVLGLALLPLLGFLRAEGARSR